MEKKWIAVLSIIIGITWVFIHTTDPYAQDPDASGISNPDTASYGKTPREYEPYGRFKKPYRRFFDTELEYPGYGRHIPEPENLKTVKIGFFGPIIASLSESIGGQSGVEPRVSQTVTNWDGYLVSRLAPIGIKMLQGARLAIEQANQAGGYRGHIPYQLIINNDNGYWQPSGKKIIHMAYRDSVWAILGSVDGEDSHIAIRVALKAELPVMNTADTDPTYVETNIPWVFRCITDDRQMCYLLADFAFKKMGLKRVAALRASDRYGRMSIDEFRDAATRSGHPFLVEMQYVEGDTDFTDQLERIKNLEADGVITYGNSRGSALIFKQMRQMGMKQWFFGSDRMVTDEFLKIVGNDAERVAAGYPYNPESQDPRYLQFVRDFQNRFGEDPETYAAHAYDGMNMIITATERAGLNRALIRDELALMRSYEGVTGTKEFDPIFTNRSPAYLAILQDGKFNFYSYEAIFSEEFNALAK